MKSGSSNFTIWNYPHKVNSMDMYILLEDVHQKSVTIDDKVVFSAFDGKNYSADIIINHSGLN